MKKRLFSALLILVMLISVLTVSALAEEPAAPSEPETVEETSTLSYFAPDGTKIGSDVTKTGNVTGTNRDVVIFDNLADYEAAEGYHFLGWKSQYGETLYGGRIGEDCIGVYAGDCPQLTAQLEECYSEDEDGECDVCDACLHTKAEDSDFCSDPVCEHVSCSTCGGPAKEVKTSTMTYFDENGEVLASPAAVTKKGEAGSVISFTVSDYTPGAGLHFVGWKSLYSSKIYKAGDSDEVYAGDSFKLYAQVEECDPVDENKDGKCDICAACLHEKKGDYCEKPVCKHKNCSTCGGAKPVEKPPVDTYIIKAGDSKHGDIRPEGKVEVTEGGSVTFYLNPDKGYEVSAIYIDGHEIDGDGYCYAHKCVCKDHKWVCKDHKWLCSDILSDYVDLSRWFDCDKCEWDWDCYWDYYCHGSCYWVLGDNKITFKNVQGNHSLYVEFAPVKEDCPSAAYKDLNTSAWYHGATDYVIESGLMKGVSATKFDPSGAATRGQLVTMLYRLAGEPAVSGESEFKDVASGEWYSKAVVWAAKKGIVTGYGDGTFGVYDVVTREQTVAILYRYAKYMGCDVSDLAELKAFLDVEEVSDYALKAFGWAVEEDIVVGKAVGKHVELDPQGTTIRVEMAALLMRFAEYVD